MILERITAMCQACEGTERFFPATVFFNENWLLRIVLDWFSTHPNVQYPLAFTFSARWFSEALLPSAFLARHRKDPLAESCTHADGVIGHFRIGEYGKADLSLLDSATQFIVLEGKIFSRLSPGVTNARFYDQAARTVACMAEVLKRKGRPPDALNRLAFYVIAPQSQIDDGVFAEETDPLSIRRKVQRRVDEYAGATRDVWLRDWFEPLMPKIEIGCLSWENVLTTINVVDPETGAAVNRYYQHCLCFNRPAED